MVLQNLEDFESDPIVEVYGPERKKSDRRVINSTSSLRQVKKTQATKAIANHRGIKDLLLWKMELQKQVTDAMEKFKSMASVFMNMQQNMLPSMQQNMNMQQNQLGGNVTPRSEVASNTERTRVGPKNLSSDSDTHVSLVVSTNNGRSSYKGRKYVMLLSHNLKEVAKG
ncbi:hypothetical protein M6B38_213670 [Iris pallida]|uniref:Uncharacterized protein n=1 Tax=Iris pallida TaxID=29817 RepID=A0AAX6E297_IRIPA|nr:hypothetical protein M6B38_213670 [Iris pallida]